MKKQLIIGIDLDDVLLDFNSSMCEFHNGKYGTSYKYEEIKKYHFEEIWDVPKEQVLDRIAEFYETDLHWNSTPVVGAISAIQKLKENHRLIIVTAKPDYLKKKTKMWLDKHYPNAFHDMHFIGHYHSNVVGPKKTKREVCDEIGIHVFVEDSMDNAISIASPERPVFLLDRPWNQGDLPENIKRVKGWEEIVGKLVNLNS